MITLLPRLDIEQVSESTLHFLAESAETDGALLDLMAKYFLTSEKLLQKIVSHPHVEKTTVNYIRLFVSPAVLSFLGLSQKTAFPSEPEIEEVEQKRIMAIGHLRIPEKIQLALKGNREARVLLLKDPNRQVVMAVLASPKLTDEEVDGVAKSKNMSEEALRVVARNPAWVKRYSITEALANNPKTPLSISLGFLKHLRAKDLERLSKNKGISAALRTTALKMLHTRRAESA